MSEAFLPVGDLLCWEVIRYSQAENYAYCLRATRGGVYAFVRDL